MRLRRERFGLIEQIGVRADALAGTRSWWKQTLMAGLLDLGPHGAVAGRSAAALLGLDDFGEALSSSSSARTARPARERPSRVDDAPSRSSNECSCGSCASQDSRPALQVNQRDGTRLIARDDTLFGTQLVIEVEGHATHSSRRQRQADEQRRTELTLKGKRVLVFTYWDVVGRPEWTASRVREALSGQCA